LGRLLPGVCGFDWSEFLKDTLTAKNSGFTIIETIVTMAIVTLVLGFVLPSVRTGLLDYRLTATAQDIASQIQSARYAALRNNSMSSFILMASGQQYGVDTNADGTVSGAQEVLLGLQSGVTCTSLSTPPVSGAVSISTGSKSGIGFTPRGTLTSLSSSTGQPDFSAAFPTNGVAIYLINPLNQFVAVTVSPAGRIRTWRSHNGVNWQ
jgi:prepilin-type N-terminal cleavage/methylation domain-containing protein